MSDLWSDLLVCRELRPVPSGGTGEHAGDGVTEFEGRNQQLDYHRVFGGQLLGQFIRIASATCPAKTVTSQHVLVTREGRAGEPIHYQATHHDGGRSFAAVTITARQSRGVIATSSTDWPRASPCAGPDPVGSSRGCRPQHRHHRPQFDVWMRTRAVATALAPALAAYATDLTLIGTALRPMDGVGQRGNGDRRCRRRLSDLKYFTEHMPATFVYAGINVERSGLFTGLRGKQISARSVLVHTGAFEYGDKWRSLVASTSTVRAP